MRSLKLYKKQPVFRLAAQQLPLRIVLSYSERQHAPIIEQYVRQTFAKSCVVQDENEYKEGEKDCSRIICVGSYSTIAVLGRKVDPTAVRQGNSWLVYEDDYIPVFWVPSFEESLLNKFIGDWFREDLKYACTTEDYWSPPVTQKYKRIMNVKDSKQAVQEMTEARWTAYDCETAGQMFGEYFEVTTVAACTDDYRCFVWNRESLGIEDVRESLFTWFKNSEAKKVGHNVKYDMLSPRSAWGIPVVGIHSDTRLKRKLLQTDALSSLELCSDLVGMGGYKQEFGKELDKAKRLIKAARAVDSENQKSEFDWVKDKLQSKEALDQYFLDYDPALLWARKLPQEDVNAFAYALVPEKELEMYCVRDALATARLENKFNKQILATPELNHIWESVVKGSTEAIEQVEAWGILVDPKAMHDFSIKITDMQKELKTYLNKEGVENPNSSVQLARKLYTPEPDGLALKVVKKSQKTGAPSVDAETLKKLRSLYPEFEFLVALEEYKRITKLKTTYGDSLAKYIKKDGRIHPELKIDGTETGRLSCRNPGLHQIPRTESEEGKLIKDCFVASPEHKLIQLDYSQMEIRVAALITGDEKMTAIIKSGKDFHTTTAKIIASAMWDIKPEEVTKKHRHVAKVFNFGLLYGMSVYGMAKRLLIEVDEAKKLKHLILGEFEGLAKWVEYTTSLACNCGYTWTWWAGNKARRRPLFHIASRDIKTRKHAENSAINTPIQGAASDFCLASINAIVKWLKSEQIPAKLVLTVHDSIVLESRLDVIDLVARKARDIMLSWDSGDVPIKVDIEIGTHWGSLEPLTLENSI